MEWPAHLRPPTRGRARLTSSVSCALLSVTPRATSLDSAKADHNKQPMSFGRWCGFAALLAAVVLLWDLREVLIGLFGSIVLSVAFCTLVGWLKQSLRWQRWQALLLAL